MQETDVTETTEAAATIAEANAVEAPIAEATEDRLVEVAQTAVSRCNWVIGECAASWTERYAHGRTDADFAGLIGLSGDQVYQRRRVWETFADVRAEYAGVRWSHFYAALNWDDAAECLGWAEEMGATVAEMKAWRRASRGEDLSQPADPETAPFEATVTPVPASITGDVGGEGGDPFGPQPQRADEPSMTAAARSVGGEDYAPFGKDARGDAPATQAESDAPVRPLAVLKKVASALERIDKQILPQVLSASHEVPEDVKDRLREALDRVSAKVAEL